jgi:hypothetical protein
MLGPILFAAALLPTAPTATPAPVSELPGSSPGVVARLRALPPAPRNTFSLLATLPVPLYGVSVAFDRRFRRRLGLGATFEYVASRPGRDHLVAFGETLSARVFARPTGRGPWAAGTLTIAHQSFVRAPWTLTAIQPGFEFGARFVLAYGLVLGGSVGLRYSIPAGSTGPLCTSAYDCPYVRHGAQPRFAFEVGWAF